MTRYRVLAAAGPRRGEAAELWEAYGCRANWRVPITFACDDQLWLRISGHTFGQFYRDPRVHLQAQLVGRRWFAEHVVGDMPPVGRWEIGVQLWMEEDEYFGCQTVYQEDDYAWARPLAMDRDRLLAHLEDLDPEEQVRRSRAFTLYRDLCDLAAGLTCAGLPVHVVPPGRSTHGIFTKAAEIRGPEQLCVDLYEAPDFAARFLGLVTDRIIGRIKAWHRLTGAGMTRFPGDSGFHFCDDSLQLLSPDLYERFVLPCHERLYAAMTTGPRRLHLCGYAAQHFPVLYHTLGVTAIDGPGPFVDHGEYLHQFGPGFSFAAQTDHQILARGSRAAIDGMMRGLLNPRTRLPGRFQVMGFVQRDTDLENVRHCYELGRRYGSVLAASRVAGSGGPPSPTRGCGRMNRETQSERRRPGEVNR